jgi:FlaA1/EpsC-like NDP-sugar epimerase
VVIWGAGPTGKRLARALEPLDVRATRFVDIDPRKIGRTARGVPVTAPATLERGREMIVVAVGSRGARSIIRAKLDGRGFAEGEDYLCAA